MNKMLMVIAAVLLGLSIVPLIILWNISPGVAISAPVMTIAGLCGRGTR